MYKKFFFVVFSIVNLVHANILLQPPKKLSDVEIEKMVKEWETEFHWFFVKGCVGLLCAYEQQKVSVILHVGYLPIRSYNFSFLQNLKKFFLQQSTISFNYYYDEPLVIMNASPQKIDRSQLLNLVLNRKFIFYTGAGISVAGNVETMSKLQESMHMQTGMLHFLKIMLQSPQKLAYAFKQFCKSCIHANPTVAHEALHKIAQQRSCAIITENVDLLHQKTHSMPLHGSSSELHTVVPDDIKEIDMIICIGLSHDDRGILQYFKKHNPTITIIAIDLGNPNYLSDSDYLTQEDLQVVIPELAKHLVC